MVVYYDEDNFNIKLYRDCVKGELVGLTEVIPIDELLEVWQKHKADTTQTNRTTNGETEPQTEQLTEDYDSVEKYRIGATDTPQTEVREVCDRDGNCSECWKELHCRAKDTPQNERSE